MYVLVTTFIALSVGLSKVIRSHVIHEKLLIYRKEQSTRTEVVM